MAGRREPEKFRDFASNQREIPWISNLSSVPDLTLFSPAKINLFLAVVGRRKDGFHDLVSLVSPVAFGDTLSVDLIPGESVKLSCDDPALATDETNLVVRAAQLFREQTGWKQGVQFNLVKRIPQGAGLGGGSSNASTALMALNQLSGLDLSRDILLDWAARLGSDCPFFLLRHAAVMRGRGDVLELVPDSVAIRLKGQRVWLFKPEIGVSTPWAYGRLASDPARHYLPSSKTEARLQAWLKGTESVGALAYNSFEEVVFKKFITLPALIGMIEKETGYTVQMSGSGSTCFTLLPAEKEPKREARLQQIVREAWGVETFFVETVLS